MNPRLACPLCPSTPSSAYLDPFGPASWRDMRPPVRGLARHLHERHDYSTVAASELAKQQ